MSVQKRKIEVSYQWLDYQRDVVDALESGDYAVVVLRTGYGGGKSRTGAQWIHKGALADRNGDAESLVVGQDHAKAEGTTYKVYFETLPGEDTVPDDAGGHPENSPIVSGYNDNKKRITYINGHVTRLGSADKWNRHAGAEFCRIWCDEVAHYKSSNTDLYKLHEMLTTRQRTEVGPNSTLWTSTGDGYDQFYDITERQVDADGEPLPWSGSLKVIVASTEDNVLLPDAERIIEQFRGTAREEQGLHGGFAAAEGLVYDDFNRPTHVMADDELAEIVDWSSPPVYGYDAGWQHPRVFLEARRTHADQWAIVDQYYETAKPFEHLCDPDNRTGWLSDHDKEQGSVMSEHEPEHIAKFRQAGFRAVKANKSLDEGIPYLRGLLGVRDGRPGLIVAESCTELIQEFMSYKEEHVGKSGDVPDHCLDALRYLVFTHRKPPTGKESGSGGGIDFL